MFVRAIPAGYEAIRKHVTPLQPLDAIMRIGRQTNNRSCEMNLMAKSEVMAEGASPIDRKKLGQIVLALQGGALGAFCRNLADDLANKSDPDL